MGRILDRVVTSIFEAGLLARFDRLLMEISIQTLLSIHDDIGSLARYVRFDYALSLFLPFGHCWPRQAFRRALFH